MASTYWMALMLGSLLAGMGVAAALAVSRAREPFAGFASVFGIALSAWSLGRLTVAYANPQAPLVGLALAIGGLAGGYALASVMLPRAAPTELPRPLAPSSGSRTAVLLLSDAESDSYDAASAARELGDLEQDGVIDLGIVATPFLFMAEKARYRAIGGTSPSRRQVVRIVESLERALGGLDVEHVGEAWCSMPGSLLDRVDELAAAGYSRIAVVPLSVGESLEMERAKMLLDRARPADAGVTIAYAQPLSSSEAIAELLARRIALGVADPAATGVALVAHGQPEARQQLKAEFDGDEAAFANRVKVLVTERGVASENVRVAWAEWRDPDVTSTVRHLAALGCDRVLVCPACFPVDCIATMLDIPMAVRRARVEPTISVVTLSTWRDEEEVVATLRDRTLTALNELDRLAP